MPAKPTIPRVCAQCAAVFLVTSNQAKRRAARFCSRPCYYAAYATDAATKTAAARQRLLRCRAEGIAFVTEVNARTACAHCGKQPIEWHNPEHIELNRQNFRIGSMAWRGYSVMDIQAELDRCTPLCRRCHIREDGRLKNLRPFQQHPELLDAVL